MSLFTNSSSAAQSCTNKTCTMNELTTETTFRTPVNRFQTYRRKLLGATITSSCRIRRKSGFLRKIRVTCCHLQRQKEREESIVVYIYPRRIVGNRNHGQSRQEKSASQNNSSSRDTHTESTRTSASLPIELR